MLDRGYHATRVSEIAEAAGLSKGAVYFHFENKRALLDALVEDEFDRAHAIFDEAEAAAADGQQPLIAAAQAFVEFLGEPDDPRHRFFVLSGELGLHEPELRERLHGHHRALIERLTGMLRQWAEDSGHRLPDVEGVAHLVTAMANGLQGWWAMGYTFDTDRMLAVAMGLLSGGLGEGLRLAVRASDPAA